MKPKKRCTQCEDLPWRRPKHTRCKCGKKHALEVLEMAVPVRTNFGIVGEVML